MSNELRVTVDVDAYYKVKTFLACAASSTAKEMSLHYAWKVEEITEMLETLSASAEYVFPE